MNHNDEFQKNINYIFATVLNELSWKVLYTLLHPRIMVGGNLTGPGPERICNVTNAKCLSRKNYKRKTKEAYNPKHL